MYKAVAFDLDGTLISDNKSILSENINVIKKIKDKIKIFLVTGRHHTATYPYHKELELDTPIICCNGAYIFNPLTNKLNDINIINKNEAFSLIESTNKIKDIHLLMYTDQAIFYQKINGYMLSFIEWAKQYPIDIRPKIYQIDNFIELILNNNNIIKFVISSSSLDKIINFSKNLSNTFSYEISWSNRLDIVATGCSKGNALNNLLKKYQINLKDTIAFGDQENDISMLSKVGLGIAMKHSSDLVKQSAKLITSDNNNPGIANILKRYF